MFPPEQRISMAYVGRGGRFGFFLQCVSETSVSICIITLLIIRKNLRRIKANLWKT